MCIRRALSLALIVSAELGASAYPPSAQSFEERWSVVPKAKAEEPAQPQTEDSGVPPQHPIDRSVGFRERTNASSSPQNRTLRRPTRSGPGGGSTTAFTGEASFIAYSGG